MKMYETSRRDRLRLWLFLSVAHLGVMLLVGPDLVRSEEPSLIAVYLVGLLVALNGSKPMILTESRVKIGKFGGLTGTLDDLV
jgi:hypothetical protein